MPQHVVLSILSPDRVGIIASVSRCIYDLGGNIDAMSETVMRGYFTIILTVSFEDRRELDEIRRSIECLGRRGELSVSIQERDLGAGAQRAQIEGEEFVLTIMGRDRPGIVSRISGYLASRSINIMDLFATTEGERFVLIGQLVVPREQDVRQIQIDLEGLWPDGQQSVSLQHVNIFVATNEINFRHKRVRA